MGLFVVRPSGQMQRWRYRVVSPLNYRSVVTAVVLMVKVNDTIMVVVVVVTMVNATTLFSVGQHGA